MKLGLRGAALRAVESLPARGAWVETDERLSDVETQDRRSPQGERGLKLTGNGTGNNIEGRSPQGERGLKLVAVNVAMIVYVAPRKGSVG